MGLKQRLATLETPFKQGVYDHYKGGVYTGLFTATYYAKAHFDSNVLVAKYHDKPRPEIQVCSSDGELFCYVVAGAEMPITVCAGTVMVIYVSHTYGTILAREYSSEGADSWLDVVNWRFGPEWDQWDRYKAPPVMNPRFIFREVQPL
jgi:hypothetical protein